MTQLILGLVITLIGLGLLLSKLNFVGILFLIIGVAIGIKGRNQIDKANYH